jgi:Outer membrane lipoprotein-sorting protein
MKTYKVIALAALGLLLATSASGQTADDIIGKYVIAIGGKDLLSKITSVYSETSAEVMGMQIAGKTIVLNGKGMRQDMDVNGSTMTNCYTDKGGWSINPMVGSTAAEDMPAAQYNSGKAQIVVGAPFINYAVNGYKAELLGTDTIAKVNAYKIKLTAPDSTSSLYFFDPNTYYLLKSVQQAEMQGQMVENIINFSDYKQTNGYTMPYKMDMNMAGGQFNLSITITKIELNKPVNDSIFLKPR